MTEGDRKRPSGLSNWIADLLDRLARALRGESPSLPPPGVETTPSPAESVPNYSAARASTTQGDAPAAPISAPPLPLRPDGTPYRYHAFLSYAAADKAEVHALSRRLKAANLQIFLDEERIRWGESIRVALTRGVLDSRFVVVFVSKATRSSDWLEFETLLAAGEDPANRRRRVLRLVLDEKGLSAEDRLFSFLFYRTTGEQSLAWPRILATLSGADLATYDQDAPFVPSTELEGGRGSLITRYRAILRHQHQDFMVRGLSRQWAFRFVMGQDWVKLHGRFSGQLAWRPPPGKAAAALLPPGEGCEDNFEGGAHEERSFSMEDAFRRALQANPSCQGVVVLGAPGSGKTTLLRRLLLRCLGEGSSALGLPLNLVPVWLPLRGLEAGDATLADFVEQTLGANPELRDLKVGPELRERSRLLVLLDGADEIADPTRRRSVLGWIVAAQQAHPDWYFVVSSRFEGWSRGALPMFFEAEIESLRREDSRRLMENWFRSALCHDPERPAEQATREAADWAADLWRQIHEQKAGARRLQETIGNPLLLTCVCFIHLRERNLPEGRARLYEKCLTLLLHDWREAQDAQQLLLGEDPKAILELLAPVAFELTQGRALLAPEGRVLEVMEQTSGRPREALADLLHNIRDRSGVFTGHSAETYGFLHKTFQEYLAAYHVAQQDRLPELAQYFGDAWWEEVLLLALAMDGHSSSRFDSFVRQLIQEGRFLADANLLTDCVTEARTSSPTALLEVLHDGQDHPWDLRVRAMELMKGRWLTDPSVQAPCKGLLERPPKWLRALSEEQQRLIRGLATSLLSERGLAAPTLNVERGPKLGDTLYHEKTGITLVWVPAGSFVMGEDDFGDEWAIMLSNDRPDLTAGQVARWRRNASPAHKVTLSQGFWLGRVPVTNEQYRRFVDATGHRPSGHDDNSQFNAPDQPVVGVDWHDAQAFCAWAEIRLPTEAQWEFAARGPEARRYPWGDTPPTAALANFGGNVDKTSPVGSYPDGASQVGALDMAGNVWEWCEDWVDAYQRREQTDPMGPSSGSFRVIRGGSWYNDAWRLRAAIRNGGGPYRRSSGLGFRVVLPSPTAQ